tara:strand:+ start:1374 stop:1565 length:192 start_codon:yes stop_codon:yes gene_type:complete
MKPSGRRKMWTVKTILLPLAAVLFVLLAMLVLVVVPVLIPEARPYYGRAYRQLQDQIKNSFRA